MDIAPSMGSTYFDKIILSHGNEISRKLNLLWIENFPPNAQKFLHEFSMAQAAHFLSTSPSTLKKLFLNAKQLNRLCRKMLADPIRRGK